MPHKQDLLYLIILTIFCITGCSAMTAESIHRHSAYDSMNSAYNALPESEPFLITFTIPEHKVTITNNCMMFDWSFAKVKKMELLDIALSRLIISAYWGRRLMVRSTLIWPWVMRSNITGQSLRMD